MKSSFLKIHRIQHAFEEQDNPQKCFVTGLRHCQILILIFSF